MPVPPAYLPALFAVPGRDETFAEAFGGLTWRHSVDVGHVDLTGSFARLRFAYQVDTVGGLIRERYWSEGTLLLGCSFGAWLLLQALRRQETCYPGPAAMC